MVTEIVLRSGTRLVGGLSERGLPVQRRRGSYTRRRSPVQCGVTAPLGRLPSHDDRHASPSTDYALRALIYLGSNDERLVTIRKSPRVSTSRAII